MTTKSHECSACEGTGAAHPCGPEHGVETCHKHGCCLCEQTSADYFSDVGCPVCQGTGRISDVIPARDAMVDAETLGNMVALCDGRAKIRKISGLWRFAARIEDGMFDSADDAARLARLSARAAFRAVPALREE